MLPIQISPARTTKWAWLCGPMQSRNSYYVAADPSGELFLIKSAIDGEYF
jgi:hypothetical protein